MALYEALNEKQEQIPETFAIPNLNTPSLNTNYIIRAKQKGGRKNGNSEQNNCRTSFR